MTPIHLNGVRIVAILYACEGLAGCQSCPLDPCCEPTVWPPTCGFDVETDEFGTIPVVVDLQCREGYNLTVRFFNAHEIDTSECRVVRCDQLLEGKRYRGYEHASFSVPLEDAASRQPYVAEVVENPREGVTLRIVGKATASHEFGTTVRGPIHGYLEARTLAYDGQAYFENGYVCQNVDMVSPNPETFRIYVPHLDHEGNPAPCQDELDGGITDTSEATDAL